MNDPQMYVKFLAAAYGIALLFLVGYGGYLVIESRNLKRLLAGLEDENAS